MADKIVYTFTGARTSTGAPKEWYPGIPARDLTAADMDRLERRGLADVVATLPIYKKAGAKNAAISAQPPAEPGDSKEG